MESHKYIYVQLWWGKLLQSGHFQGRREGRSLLQINLKEMGERVVDGTGSGSCPVVGFAIISVEHSGSATG